MSRRQHSSPTTKKQVGTRLIAFKASPDHDADILAWWDGLPEGDRSRTLRDLIRLALGRGSLKPEAAVGSPNTDQITRDTAWIRAALLDLPGYLERVIGEVAATAHPTNGVTAVMQTEPEQPRLEQQALDQRRQKMSCNQW